jgi:hypothetical protein
MRVLIVALLLSGCASRGAIFTDEQMTFIKALAQDVVTQDRVERNLKRMEAEAKEADIRAVCESRATQKEIEESDDFERRLKKSAKKNRERFGQ